jgi:hypothetical protein
MANWYYRGRIPTPISDPEKGSFVLTRGKRFSASESAVAHLLSIGQVIRMPDTEVSVSVPDKIIVTAPYVPLQVSHVTLGVPPEGLQPPEENIPEGNADEAFAEGDVVESEPHGTTDGDEAAAEEVRDDVAVETAKQKKQRRGQRNG